MSIKVSVLAFAFTLKWDVHELCNKRSSNDNHHNK